MVEWIIPRVVLIVLDFHFLKIVEKKRRQSLLLFLMNDQ
jgi:uncharacterized membrane protein